MTEIRTLRTETTGRYLVEGASVPHAPLLVGFHGYGQNAEALLDDLRRIPGAEAWTLVSVQALHRFYNRSHHVVASWMTSQDRELAIADNLAYVARVVAELRAETGATKLVFAGFSQGAAMAYRAAAHLKPCDGLIVLGGDLPKDVAELPSLTLPPIHIGRGEQDSLYTAEQLAKDVAALEARGVRPEVCRFAGGHEWAPVFLEAAGRFLERITP
jgi:predicted esterase